MNDVVVGFALTVVSLVVFMALSYWQLRRVHGTEPPADRDSGQTDDTGSV